uniref:B30.2/SPRY domain-containing protein n=1 Tax=Globodera rostochiensis TaxID=31243 RepID=A0A914HNL3_GLORO
MFTNNGNMFVSTAYMIEHRGVREECCTFMLRRSENAEYFEARMVKKAGTVCVGMTQRSISRMNTIGWAPGSFGIESSGELFYDGQFDQRVSNIIEGDVVACSWERTQGRLTYFLNDEKIG